MGPDEENGIIREVNLEIEDHGILVADVQISFDGTEQGYIVSLTESNTYIAIRSILEAVGKNSWENLPGTAIRVQREKGMIRRIGHTYKDQWSKRTEDDA